MMMTALSRRLPRMGAMIPRREEPSSSHSLASQAAVATVAMDECLSAAVEDGVWTAAVEPWRGPSSLTPTWMSVSSSAAGHSPPLRAPSLSLQGSEMVCHVHLGHPVRHIDC